MTDTLTDADFLREVANHYIYLLMPGAADRLRAISLDLERMEAELNRITQEAREAHAAMEGLKT